MTRRETLPQAACLLAVMLAFAAALPAHSFGQPASPTGRVVIGYVGRAEEPPRTASPIDETASDAGLQGARLGVADDNTTGRFTGQIFTLEEAIVAAGEDAVQRLRGLLERGPRMIIADMPAEDLLATADVARDGRALLLNIRSGDDALRNEACRPNVLHIAPTRAMLADALAQYLVAKQWPRWFLVVGRDPGDALFADAIRRAATRFGGRIVVEKPWSFQAGYGRADTGHVALQAEILAFTRVADYDVLVVADEADEFGEYLPDRTALPRPVAGTQGLTPAAWSPVHEQWGAAQLQDRFRRQAGHRMGSRDYAGWLAARAIGEAAVRTRSTDERQIEAYLRGPEFVVAGFKGQGLTFREWDGQLRQPILIAGPKLLVSVSPQPGFLHQFSELDTLGYDRSETLCHPS